MFSGIVERIGWIKEIFKEADNVILELDHQGEFSDLKLGDSVSVNGVCLTVTELETASFRVCVVPETLRLSNLSRCAKGQAVNLERSLKYGDRIGGHYVQGHVDGVGEILRLAQDGEKALLVTVEADETLLSAVIVKGYIAIDGMSLTVIDKTRTHFSVTLIPHTRHHTIAQYYQVGTQVNLEMDIFIKDRLRELRA